MLQQTRVAAARKYYARFLQRFPDVHRLAAAPLEEVLEAWAGLGYYARARLAHACARTLVREHDGCFPRSAEELQRLPGIGASSAAAIAAFCFGERVAILDANVKRVLARRYAIEGPVGRAQVIQELWRRARSLLPAAEQIGVYTQAIMDLGASVCTRSRPRCGECPVRDDCLAREQGRAEQLPTRAPAAKRPVRTAHLLLAVAQQRVFLEQRAARGIWGGLLSLPQFARPEELRRAADAFGRVKPRALAQRTHSFTHFTLRFTPHLLRLPRAPGHRVGRSGRWVALARIESAALPSPVRALLRDVREGRTEP